MLQPFAFHGRKEKSPSGRDAGHSALKIQNLPLAWLGMTRPFVSLSILRQVKKGDTS